MASSARASGAQPATPRPPRAVARWILHVAPPVTVRKSGWIRNSVDASHVSNYSRVAFPRNISLNHFGPVRQKIFRARSRCTSQRNSAGQSEGSGFGVQGSGQKSEGGICDARVGCPRSRYFVLSTEYSVPSTGSWTWPLSAVRPPPSDFRPLISDLRPLNP